ncbi:hypothetical protein C4D60_Mb03t02470 [Musa balbisiana]|uniref:Uncharacterized protein n=1 Tax=Musa balbisiana TaxID=52838 RepID=A0A4S8J727_MUSBA|nr:hypothetical protein C4D60_Mb03t02470 [Musa balbisiana]
MRTRSVHCRFKEESPNHREGLCLGEGRLSLPPSTASIASDQNPICRSIRRRRRDSLSSPWLFAENVTFQFSGLRIL